VAEEELRYNQHAAFSEWLAHLCDAFELMDWRSGSGETLKEYSTLEVSN